LGIRIIAPIPGKGTVGIEVPNKTPQIVSMYSIIASRKFQESKYELPIVMGKTITNEVYMTDLTKMPHVLVAGATGQGKSVGLNAIITSLLYKKHPAELKFVLVDPKKVEFSIYSVIERHFLAKLPDTEEPIITDTSKVVQTLQSITHEMDMRYELLKNARVRNIKEYNAKFKERRLLPSKGHRFLPYIVDIIEEFSDLLMTAGKEVESPIIRIAQLARAVGIHMIIATQRPSTNVITGIIKANFPARFAFRVQSMVDSRTILDCPGANQLIGRGDMLISESGDMTRVQCAFVDTPEVENICNYISEQQGYPDAHLLPEYVSEESGEGSNTGTFDSKDRDPLFEEVARIIVSSQQASTSSLQRRYSIGYNRAGRIMDQLEAAGIVGPAMGGRPREVLIMDIMQLENKLEQLK
jgi:S-DNA-T family DNA segregation ATPase FtsK/SpoIIIE